MQQEKDADGGEKSNNRMSPRRFQLKKFQANGFKIKECKVQIADVFEGYYKVKREKAGDQSP